ncbi:pentapeptide repeat-containing protein [Streptomyces sp. NPDC048179]|uniref:pentapeptide repeat-containing protein n=1 Tax=Streptomyces sp. NPDC048179 TaxID=3365506 RepID=UPI0037115176
MSHDAQTFPAITVLMMKMRGRSIAAFVRNYWNLGATIVGSLAFALLLWQGPWWLDGAHLRRGKLEPADGVVITGFRASLVAAVGGVVASLTLHHNRKKDARDAELAREGHVTGRYVEAVKLLASDALTERLGGIYALERIMRDSERDHNTVVEVLSAFIREHAPKKAANGERSGVEPKAEGDTRRGQLRGDLQAALVVLGRRPDREPLEEEGGLERINLTQTDLRGAELYNHSLRNIELREAWLDNAQFFRVDLFGAELQRSCFVGADFCWANLLIVNLEGADLRNARLHGACLENATLRRADLRGADMTEAQLQGADLRDAQLDGTTGLTVEQIIEARIFPSTKLPMHIAQDAHVRVRIEECEIEEAERRAARQVR